MAGVAACARVQYMITALIETGCITATCNSAARLPVTAEVIRSGYRKALLFTLLLTLLPVSAHALTPPGTVISSTATATFDIGGPVVTATSNTVDVVTTIIQTPSTITMYQYDPIGPGTVSQTAVTQHATSGPPAAGFVVSPDPSYTLIGTGTTTLDPTTCLLYTSDAADEYNPV